jgi:shikimate kinase
MSNIILAGFMGTGKSTVGPLVATRLGWTFVDTDALIVERAGMPIPQIFEQHGEDVFREYEAQIAASVAARQHHVIATGGGLMLNPGSRALLSRSGVIICLEARPDVIEARLAAGDGRPLAADWRDLLERRQPIYAALPHHIDTSDLPAEAVAQEVIALWQSST